MDLKTLRKLSKKNKTNLCSKLFMNAMLKKNYTNNQS